MEYCEYNKYIRDEIRTTCTTNKKSRDTNSIGTFHEHASKPYKQGIMYEFSTEESKKTYQNTTHEESTQTGTKLTRKQRTQTCSTNYVLLLVIVDYNCTRTDTAV